MDENDLGEKSEEATEHRRREERRRGNVPHSMELNLAGHLLATSILLYVYGRSLVRALGEMLTLHLKTAADRPLDRSLAVSQFQAIAVWSAQNVLPWFVAITLAAIVINLAQVGFLWASEKLNINFNHINPVTGFQRLFSSRSFAVLLVSIAKFSVLLGTAFWFTNGELPRLLALSHESVGTIAGVIGTTVGRLGLWLASLLGIIGVADFGYRRWKYDRDIMMTKDEVKREHKEQDGDPMIIQRRRAAHRKLVEASNIREVAKADVLITNPTHVAVAVKFDPRISPAPIVIAKGLDEVALRMRKVATEHNIPIIERPELARRLYKELRVGQGIPLDLYAVFGEIMRYVYEITKRALNDDGTFAE